ncbi:MAG: potassium-transporting ATPase subunit KdpA [Candidatus Zixiibacteriota bacterium]
MSMRDLLQVFIYAAALVGLGYPIGLFIARVLEGKRTFMSPVFGWMERLIYRVCGVDPAQEMKWTQYAIGLLAFNFFSFLIVFVLQLVQTWLPMNPQHLANTSWHLAFNTAVSFMTNTNWQAYAGETTMSYFTQMVGLAVQNFVSAATAVAVLVALIRGFRRKSSATIGNFWADLTRSTIYIFLPLSIVFAIFLVSQGVVQSNAPSAEITTIEGATQTIPLGPAASQIAIKQLGTNGGGFYNANSAHPLENPTPASNFLEMLALLLLPAAFVVAFGKLMGSMKHARVVFVVMFLIWGAGLGLSLWAEFGSNQVVHQTALMEGKETRFGVTNSIIWSVSTTCASNGSVNAMHSSLSPIAGGIAMFNILLGEIVFGGVGCGVYGMVLFVLLTVFLAGLMVGRTPEYFGKKVEAREVTMVIVGVLAPSAAMLILSGASAVLPFGLSSLANKGPHGLSEIMYAFASGVGNNGSAFAGLNANTPWYNVTIGLAMLIGRFGVLIPTLAIAGSMAAKKISPPSGGTFATDTPIFGVLLVGVIIIVGALTFFPALSLGPIIEHLLMGAGTAF